jgi:hypothetical protein
MAAGKERQSAIFIAVAIIATAVFVFWVSKSGSYQLTLAASAASVSPVAPDALACGYHAIPVSDHRPCAVAF